jgi:hypothetical protein
VADVLPQNFRGGGAALTGKINTLAQRTRESKIASEIFAFFIGVNSLKVNLVLIIYYVNSVIM